MSDYCICVVSNKTSLFQATQPTKKEIHKRNTQNIKINPSHLTINASHMAI